MEYFRIPGTVLKDNSISALSRLIYGVVYKYAYNGKAEFCWAGNKHLARMFDVSEKTIERSVKELAGQGYLDLEYCKGRTRKMYPLCELAN
jgi:hypothetical protein